MEEMTSSEIAQLNPRLVKYALKNIEQNNTIDPIQEPNQEPINTDNQE